MKSGSTPCDDNVPDLVLSDEEDDEESDEESLNFI